MELLGTKADSFTVDQYFDVLQRWLALEGAAERQRMADRRHLKASGDAERSGETIVNLRLADHRIGLAGRLLLDLVKLGNLPLPMNRLKVGSPIILSDGEDPQDEGLPGVVSRRQADLIQVAVERWPDGTRYRLDLSPDETTRRRQLAAMAAARHARGGARGCAISCSAIESRDSTRVAKRNWSLS